MELGKARSMSLRLRRALRFLRCWMMEELDAPPRCRTVRVVKFCKFEMPCTKEKSRRLLVCTEYGLSAPRNKDSRA